MEISPTQQQRQMQRVIQEIESNGQQPADFPASFDTFTTIQKSQLKEPRHSQRYTVASSINPHIPNT